ncbi:MAG: hypothetical protein ACRDM7_09115 [Thermoleophilaceae bacterium]
MFVVADGQPRATGFLMSIPEPIPEGEVVFPYIVTARHVVEDTASREFFVRVNVEDRYDEIPTTMEDWFIHDPEDVAVIRFAGGPSSPKYQFYAESTESFIQPD